MKLRYVFMALAGISMPFCVMAQEVIPADLFTIQEALLESVGSAEGETADFDALLNELEKLQRNPVDLNRADRQELHKLFFLTDFQITSLIDYRQQNGLLLSENELQLVYGFTDEVIAMMLPFVVIRQEAPDRVFNLGKTGGQVRHEAILRTQRVIEEARAYHEFDSAAGTMHYPGSPWLINAKYGIAVNDHLQAGITMEKDAGEDFFKGSNPGGFDFYSAYCMLNDVGPMKSAIIGDFRLAFGQGLTVWSGSAPGKSSMPMSIVKRRDALKAFTSQDENNFYRGAAATANWGKFTITGFFSVKKRDANITDTISQDEVCFSSFQEGGYHRTLSEIEDEKALRETAFGANLSFRNQYLKLGSTLASYYFDKNMEAGNEPEDIHDFEGNRLVNWGIDYLLTLKKVQLFGETAYGNHYWATLNGLLLNVNKYASFSILYRYFGVGYYTHAGSAFSESASDANEEGFYAGLIIHPVAKVQISGYVDFYRFPWLKSGLSAPASGNDYMAQIDFKPRRQTSMYLRVKYESDPEDAPQTATMPEVTELQRTGVRYHIAYQVNRKLWMQNRLEVVNSKPGSADASKGIMVYHDIRYRTEKLPLEVDFRLAWFNTSDYDARIYAYEQDITSGFSFSPLYEEGYRSYVMVQYDLTKQVSCRFRISQTGFFNLSSVGSGYDRIDGNKRTEVKIQIAARF